MPKMTPISVEDAEDRKRDRTDGLKIKHKGVEVTRGQMTAALAKVNQQPIIDAEDARHETVIWDRASPINGVPASRVLATRVDIPVTGDVYLVTNKDTGQVLTFQPFKPRVGGRQPMTNAEAQTIGEEHRSEVANDRAIGKIIEALGKELDEG